MSPSRRDRVSQPPRGGAHGRAPREALDGVDAASGAVHGRDAGSGAVQGRDAAAGLEPFRRQLDRLDEQITQLLGQRFEVCRQVAFYKRQHRIPMMQPQRVAAVRQRYLDRGAHARLPAHFSSDLFELLIAATCKMEDELIDGPSGGGTRPRRPSSPDERDPANGPGGGPDAPAAA